MKLNELKAELEVEEKEVKNLNSPEKHKHTEIELVNGDILVNNYEFNPNCSSCLDILEKSAKIEYLKKGISACEEILNHNPKLPKLSSAIMTLAGTERQDKTTVVHGVEDHGNQITSDGVERHTTQTLMKQALSQRTKMIFDRFDEYACIKNDKWYLDLKEEILNSQSERKDEINNGGQNGR